MFFSTVQRYELWKYLPNFLQNSENITIFAAEKENLSIQAPSERLKQNKTLNYDGNPR